MPFYFQQSYLELPQSLYIPTNPTPVKAPTLLAANVPLANFLSLDSHEIASPAGINTFSGNVVPEGALPVAMAYAGHQFGHLVPRLGDGRALLLGEVLGLDGRRYDLQLKGSGRTPFSRGGDGRAAIGPVLREYLVSEAMAALGVPTTRALCAVATGEILYREEPLPGAILTRVALSHLRIGTFEYLALQRDLAALRALVSYALARLYPDRKDQDGAALSLLDQVIGAQARLVAHWMALGFVHGVMNTDNMSISGETIDYGPCAFLDVYSPSRTFSSIDRHGRYGFANQPACALWNLTRLAETLLPLVIEDYQDEARATTAVTSLLESFSGRFEIAYTARMSQKLGFHESEVEDLDLAQSLLNSLAEHRIDYTLFFSHLTRVVAGHHTSHVTELFPQASAPQEEVKSWILRWQQRLSREPSADSNRSRLMRKANPVFIPRNHRIEEVIEAATQGDMDPFHRLHSVLSRPYEEQAHATDLATPPGEEQWQYRTFCGT